MDDWKDEACRMVEGLREATDRNRNRELHELLGHCWHEWELSAPAYECKKCGQIVTKYESTLNPDYTADPRLVLWDMQKQDDWDGFCAKFLVDYEGWDTHYLLMDLFLDTTGKLADLASGLEREAIRKERGRGNQ